MSKQGDLEARRDIKSVALLPVINVPAEGIQLAPIRLGGSSGTN